MLQFVCNLYRVRMFEGSYDVSPEIPNYDQYNYDDASQKIPFYEEETSEPINYYQDNESYQGTSDYSDNQYYEHDQSVQDQQKSNILRAIPSSITVTRETFDDEPQIIEENIKDNSDEAPEIIEENIEDNVNNAPEVNEDDDSFNIYTEYDEYGSEEIVLEGNQKLFIKTIHDEVLNFLKSYQVPLKSLCFFLLNTGNDKDLADFFSRTEWSTFSLEQRRLYHRLNDWVSEPVTTRLQDLIQKENDLNRKNTLLKIYNNLVNGTVEKEIVYSNPEVGPASNSDPHDEIDELLLKLQSSLTPGPPRTVTTEEERRAIKGWSIKNPTASSEEKKSLALSLGLTHNTIHRLFSYATTLQGHRKGARATNQRQILRRNYGEIMKNMAHNDNSKDNHLPIPIKPGTVSIGNNIFGKQILVTKTPSKIKHNQLKAGSSQIIGQNTNVSYSSIKATKTPSKLKERQININAPQIITNNSTMSTSSITAAIQNAIKSGTLKGVNFKKPLKVIVRPKDDSSHKEVVQQVLHQKEFVQKTIRQKEVAQKIVQPKEVVQQTEKKYNRVALVSYFKNKPNPTEDEIRYFVECTKVPYNVTKTFVNLMQGTPINEVVPSSSPSPPTVEKQMHWEGPEYTRIQSTDSSIISTASPSYQLGESSSHQSLPMQNHSSLQPTYPQYLQTFQPPQNWDQNQWYQSSYSYDQQYQNPSDSYSSENYLNEETGAIGGLGGGLIPELSNEQRSWFQDFTIKNPNPEMQDIVEFSKNIGMEFENVLLVLEMDYNIFYNPPDKEQPKVNVENSKINLLNSLDEETLQLLKDINDFKAENFSEFLESELKSMFGNKIFCTLDNVKSFATAKGLNFPDIYRKLNSNSDTIQLVSEETCKRIIRNSKSCSDTTEEAPLKEESNIPEGSNDWLTSCDLNLSFSENSSQAREVKPSQEYFEYDDDQNSPKRKNHDLESPDSKKIKTEFAQNDSGYLTPDISQNESNHSAQDQTLDFRNLVNNIENGVDDTDILNNIIMENIGEVNMLDESLGLFNDSITNVDLVNEMFQKVDEENESLMQKMPDHLKERQYAPKKVPDEDFEAILASLSVSDEGRKKEKIKREKREKGKEKGLRKLFQGPFQNFTPILQVLSFKSSFKPYVFEVELSDGKEKSRNFYFKSGAERLEQNQLIKLQTVRHVGSKICVDSFEILEAKEDTMGDPQAIDENFFKRIRSTRIDPLEILQLQTPKTILDFIALEENLVSFIESRGIDVMQLCTSGSEDDKKDVIFNLCQTQKHFSSKLLQILSRLLGMNKSDIESFVSKSLLRISESSDKINLEHSYFNMYKTVINQ